jgi:asparagine synthetase B (glutamine-hydrolysing)
VLEVARHLPTRFKHRSGEGKPILREICSRYLPEEVARWPKIGFQTPDRDWVMGPGSVWCSRLFDGGDGHISRLIPEGRHRDLLDIDDHETRWLLITLELALRQLQDQNSVDPSISQM